MTYRLHREIDDSELLYDDNEAELCPHCGGDTTAMDEEGGAICAECKSPLFVNEDPTEEVDDEDEDYTDDFSAYLADLERDMGDGDDD